MASASKISLLQSPDCEKILRKFIDSNLVAIFRCKRSGEILEVNEAVAKLLGYRIEELMNGELTVQSFMLTEDKNRLSKDLSGFLDSTHSELGHILPLEREFVRKDGTRACVLIVAVTAIDNPEREIFAFCIDRSQQKAAKAELEASRAQFKLLAEAIPQLVWICDRKGKTVYINQRFFDVTGFPREADDGLLWLSALHPHDRRKVRVQAMRAERLKKSFECQARFMTQNNGARWHIIRALPLEDENYGVQWFGTATDIDQQVRLQENILRREKYFRTLANAIPQIVWTANSLGEIDFFNHRWFEYTGLSLDESQNEGWQFLIHPADRKKYLTEWKNALATGDSYEMEFRLKRVLPPKTSNMESYRWHLGRAVALRNKDNQIIKWFATWTEIESQMRARSKH